jgi:hypothetical protein
MDVTPERSAGVCFMSTADLVLAGHLCCHRLQFSCLGVCRTISRPVQQWRAGFPAQIPRAGAVSRAAVVAIFILCICRPALLCFTGLHCCSSRSVTANAAHTGSVDDVLCDAAPEERQRLRQQS